MAKYLCIVFTQIFTSTVQKMNDPMMFCIAGILSEQQWLAAKPYWGKSTATVIQNNSLEIFEFILAKWWCMGMIHQRMANLLLAIVMNRWIGMRQQMGEYETSCPRWQRLLHPIHFCNHGTLDNGNYIADHRDKLMGSFHVTSIVMNKIAPSLQPEIIAEW